jgi:hypothetical protein
MRWFLLFIILALVLGCSRSPLPEGPAKFNVSLLNASHSEEFDSGKNRTMDTISFMMANNEDFGLDCHVLSSISNGTNSSSSRGAVGVLQPGRMKNITLRFEMFSGNSSLSIAPDCEKAS